MTRNIFLFADYLSWLLSCLWCMSQDLYVAFSKQNCKQKIFLCFLKSANYNNLTVELFIFRLSNKERRQKWLTSSLFKVEQKVREDDTPCEVKAHVWINTWPELFSCSSLLQVLSKSTNEPFLCLSLWSHHENWFSRNQQSTSKLVNSNCSVVNVSQKLADCQNQSGHQNI